MSILDSKVAIVTGAAGGLGVAHCRALLAAGASAVVMTDLAKDPVEEAARSLDPAGARTLALEHDVSREESWKAVLEMVLARFDSFNVLVNNAGISPNFSIEDTTLEQWHSIMRVNLDGTFLGTRMAIERMRKTGGGSIVNISSIGAKTPSPASVGYCASKAGVCVLTKSAALHCAVNGYGIRVNSILPGPVATNMVNLLRDNPATRASYNQMLAAMPLKRLATPEEIANVVVFLASDASSYMTGADVIVDGAYSCW